MGDSVTVYVVSAMSLEKLRRARQGGLMLRPIDVEFAKVPDSQKPVPEEVARFFSRADAEAYRDNLHPSWFRPTISEATESRSQQHHAHGGEVGK